MRHNHLRDLPSPSELAFALFPTLDRGRFTVCFFPWVARSNGLLGSVMASALDRLPRVIQVYPRWGFGRRRILWWVPNFEILPIWSNHYWNDKLLTHMETTNYQPYIKNRKVNVLKYLLLSNSEYLSFTVRNSGRSAIFVEKCPSPNHGGAIRNFEKDQSIPTPQSTKFVNGCISNTINIFQHSYKRWQDCRRCVYNHQQTHHPYKRWQDVRR